MICEHLPLNVIVASLRVKVPYGVRDNFVRQRVLDKHQMSREIIVHVVLELIDGMLNRVWRWTLGKYQLERDITLPRVKLDPSDGVQIIRAGWDDHESWHTVVIVSELMLFDGS